MAVLLLTYVGVVEFDQMIIFVNRYAWNHTSTKLTSVIKHCVEYQDIMQASCMEYLLSVSWAIGLNAAQVQARLWPTTVKTFLCSVSLFDWLRTLAIVEPKG